MERKVSVVIPFFQREAGLLRKAVESALKQRGDFQMEIVIVDDGSPIPARRELRDLLSRDRNKFLIVEQKNAGCFGAANTALNKVSPNADYIAFLDSDDEWFDGHLERAVWALDHGCDYYFSDFYQLNQTVTAFNRAKRIQVSAHTRIHPSEPIHEFCGDMVTQILEGNLMGVSTVVYNFKTFQDLRYVDFVRLAGAEYVFFLTLALRSKKIAFSSVPECRYGGGVNVFSESGWGTDKYLHLRHDEIKTRKYMLQRLALSPYQKKLVRRKINTARIAFGRGLIHNLIHNGRVSRELLLNVLTMDPITYLTLAALPGMVAYEKVRGLPG
jgi:succinoglycan biosynthesis protein ExoW